MKVFNWIRNVLFFAAAVVVTASALCFILHLQPSIVLSDSMKPAFEKGGAVFVKVGSSYEIGDAIAFYSGSVYATHRLIDITQENGQTYYVTKGDNNRDMTERLLREDIVGKVWFYIPYAGYVFAFAKSRKGIIVFGSLVICLILSMFMSGSSEDDKSKHNRSRTFSGHKAAVSGDATESAKTVNNVDHGADELLYRLLWESHFDILYRLAKKNCIRSGFIEHEKLVFREEPEKNGYEKLYYRHFAVLELLKKKGIAEETMLREERKRFPEPV